MSFSRYRINIYSEDPDTLQAFYTDVMSLPFDRKIDVPDDYGYVFKLGEGIELFVAHHSEVKGKVTDSFRHIFDLQVPSVKDAFDALIERKPDVQIIAAPFQAPCSMVATFADPEGNVWQFSEGENCEYE